MTRSMTGYGKGESLKHDRKISVEIKAVNHRYCDLAIRSSKALAQHDSLVRQVAAKKVFRGKLDVSISLESVSKDDAKVSINYALADMYVRNLRELIGRYDLAGNIDLSDLLRFGEIMTLEKPDPDEEAQEEIRESLVEALEMALGGLVSMREAEGLALKRDMGEKIKNVRSLVAAIKARSPQAAKDNADKLKARLAEALLSPVIDQGRLVSEIAIMADKACIDEEITRAESHLDQLEGFLESDEPIGRRLDFLIQELNREANTIGSKCSDLAIISNVVEMKSEIEKIREQAQNIE
ncbi:MAG: YicC family protein [Clostridiales bacterium]|jgi:uncharacterized protein (TIGR00255 family)|nr:YicC family protein [Clostridiales bacterium]